MAVNGLEIYVSRFSLRKVATVGLGAALLGSGLTAGLGAGVASAAPSADCKSSVSVSAGLIEMTKEVVSGEVAPGGTVSFISTYSGGGLMLDRMYDYAPKGFTLVKAETSAKILGVVGVTDDVTGSTGGVPNEVNTSGGWSTAGGSQIILKTTYQAPADLIPGTKMYAGGGGYRIMWVVGGNHTWNPFEGLCMTVREKNINEAVGGSLEAVGLGSVNTASANAFGSLLNPSGSIAGIVSGLPLGDILGGVLGGATKPPAEGAAGGK